MKTIILTGAGGFLGSNLLSSLGARYRFICPMRDVSRKPTETGGRVEFISYSDLKNRPEIRADIFVHLAAQVHRMGQRGRDDLAGYVAVNRDLTLDMASLAIKLGVETFLFSSSVKVMGEKPGAYDGDSRPEPTEPYGVSKLEAEKGLVDLFSGRKSPRCVILRLPMVYGPGNKGNMPLLLSAARKRIPLPLGAAKSKRSFLYVKNFCDAVETAIKSKKTPTDPRAYFIADAVDMTSRELFETIYREFSGRSGSFYFPETGVRLLGNIGSGLEAATGRKMPLSDDVVSRLFDEYRFSAAAFADDYDWTPKYDGRRGIAETVEWFRSAFSK